MRTCSTAGSFIQSGACIQHHRAWRQREKELSVVSMAYVVPFVVRVWLHPLLCGGVVNGSDAIAMVEDY